MDRLWFIAALLAVWVGFRLALRPALALLFGEEIGKRALARVPERVSLSRRGDDAWKDPDQARRRWEPLLAHGFVDAGTFGVNEMPGVVMRLLASPADSILAVAYEHPRVGQWLELTTYYTDGHRFSATNQRATGMDSPPFVTVLRAAGVSSLKMLDLVRHKRPAGMMVPLTPADVARRFELGYADAMAWRRGTPITTREVVKVAVNRRAA